MDWMDARRPVPRLWMHSTEVGGGGGGGGASLGEWDTTTVAVTRYQTWISIPHMVACAELPYKKSNFKMLSGVLEVPWTNEFAVKGKVAPAKRLKKTW